MDEVTEPESNTAAEATLAPEGRWYRLWRQQCEFLAWATAEQLQAYQDALRAAREANAPTPLPPAVKAL
jgi:hypothetical protein